MAFCSLKELNAEGYEGVIEAIERELGNEQLQKVIMFERGLGLESTGVVVSVHEDYSSCVERSSSDSSNARTKWQERTQQT